MKAACERVAIVLAVGCLLLCSLSPAHAQFCLEQADCNDHNACTSDTCVVGVCVHLGGDCNDFNLCTIDHCDPASGCSHTPKNCDDGNPCTTDSCDLFGNCQHAPKGAGTQCTLADHCNSPGACSAQGACVGTVCFLDQECLPGSFCIDNFCTPCDDGNSCTMDTCPGRSCAHTPRSGAACDDGNACTTNDICLNGVCVGMGGADTDGDGFCDSTEAQAQCNAADPAEIPAQANVYAGGYSNTPGEVLLTFRSPTDRDVHVSTNASCATAGACNLATGLCMSGKIADPCATNAECNEPPQTCRVIVNSAGVPDVGQQMPQDKRPAFEVMLKVAHQPAVDLTASFRPTTPGCSRKVDLTLPSSFTRAITRFRIRGTTAGKRRVDNDKIRFLP